MEGEVIFVVDTFWTESMFIEDDKHLKIIWNIVTYVEVLLTWSDIFFQQVSPSWRILQIWPVSFLFRF